MWWSFFKVLTNEPVDVWHSDPKYLWQYIANISVVLRVLASRTFEVVNCNARGKNYIFLEIILTYKS